MSDTARLLTDVLPADGTPVPARHLAALLGVSPRDLRHMVQSAILDGACIVATNDGYRLPTCAADFLPGYRRHLAQTRTCEAVDCALRDTARLRGWLEGAE